MTTDDTGSLSANTFGLAMIVLALLGCTIVIVNIRNVPLWLLRLRGVTAAGVVDRVEIRFGDNGQVYYCPQVSYTTAAGAAVSASPVVYRRKCRLAPGSPVRVSYARSKPERIVVHGFDFRPIEAVSIGVGVLIVIMAVVVGMHPWTGKF